MSWWGSAVFPGQLFFRLSFMYRRYTAMICHALCHSHICTSDSSSLLHFVTTLASLLHLPPCRSPTSFSIIPPR